MDVDQAKALLEAMRTSPPGEIQEAALGEALKAVAYHFRRTLTGVSMKGVRGAPDWLGYETSLWSVSEDLRKFLQKRKNLRGRNILFDCCEELARDSSLGKGRQNLVLLLGQYGGLSYSDILETLLSDEDVYGHAIKGIARAKIPGLENKVRAVLEEEKIGWIRNAARKYLKEFG